MGNVPRYILSASVSPDGWPEKGRHIGGQKAEFAPCSCSRVVIGIVSVLLVRCRLRVFSV